MSFKRNEKMEQITLDDSFYRLSERNQKIVLSSWAKDFAEIVFPAINEDRFSVLYSDKSFSRPNTPVNIIVGALILKENGGLSDSELMETFAATFGISMRCIQRIWMNSPSVTAHSVVFGRDCTSMRWRWDAIFWRKK